MLKWGTLLTTAQYGALAQREVMKNAITFSERAEQLGFDAVWLLEHHFTKFGLCPSAITMAGYILGRTKRLKVGSAISIIPVDHPVRLAEKVAVLDQLSDGRFYFGIGRGSFVKDFHVFNTDMSRNHEMLYQWTDVMMSAWTRGRCSASSDLLRFEEVPVYPEPFTKPHPPLYVACSSPSTIEWAAKLGLPMMLEYSLEDEKKLSQLELYDDVASSAGHDTAKIDHVLSLLCGVAEDGDMRRQRDNLVWYGEEFLRASMLFGSAMKSSLPNYEVWHRRYEEGMMSGDWKPEQRVERVFRLNPIGTVDHCIERLQRTVELTGIGHIVCAFETAGPDMSAICDSMQRFREEVIPRIKPGKR
ncbi:LLM class flavin-dependent oxidoreductase [Pendulispora albinea]|uniref:bacterial luciferase n=1 Tax=Pendulispora albinea TaxID=2741071 RepID=A0ABZ2LQV3_9BACT